MVSAEEGGGAAATVAEAGRGAAGAAQGNTRGHAGGIGHVPAETGNLQ